MRARAELPHLAGLGQREELLAAAWLMSLRAARTRRAYAGDLRAWLAWLAFVGAMLALAVVIGVVESVMARLRLTQVPSLLLAACLMSAFGVLLLVRS